MWSTPMMRLGTLFIGIKGQGLNPMLASNTYQDLLNHSGGYVTDEMLHELQNDINLKMAIISELEAVRNGAYGTHFLGQPAMRQWIWPWSTDVENALEDSLAYAPEKEGKSMWEYVNDIITHPVT